MAWSDDVYEAVLRIGGAGAYEEIYASVAEVRPNRPENWTAIVRRTIQERSSDSEAFLGKEDLYFSVDGIGQGVWGLRGMTAPLPQAVDISEGNEVPARAEQVTYRILRDTKLARQMKLLHSDQCQICGLALEKADGQTYSEAHHIIPLGAPHNGPDVPSNILVVCPNHHALCDFGAIKLELKELRRVPGHLIAPDSISYHNEKIFGSI